MGRLLPPDDAANTYRVDLSEVPGEVRPLVMRIVDSTIRQFHGWLDAATIQSAGEVGMLSHDRTRELMADGLISVAEREGTGSTSQKERSDKPSRGALAVA